MLLKQFPYIAAQKRTLAVSCDFMNVVILFVYSTFFWKKLDDQTCDEEKHFVDVRNVRETFFIIFIRVTTYSIFIYCTF